MKKIFISTILALSTLSSCFGTESSSSSTVLLASASQEAAFSRNQSGIAEFKGMLTKEGYPVDGKPVYSLDFETFLQSPCFLKYKEFLDSLRGADDDADGPKTFLPMWDDFRVKNVKFVKDAIKILNSKDIPEGEKIEQLNAQAGSQMDSCIINETIRQLIEDNNPVIKTMVKWTIASYYYHLCCMQEQYGYTVSIYFSQGNDGQSSCYQIIDEEHNNMIYVINVNIPEWIKRFSASSKSRAYLLNHEFGHLIFACLPLRNHIESDLGKNPLIKKAFPFFDPEHTMSDYVETIQIMGCAILKREVFEDESFLRYPLSDWGYVYQGEFPMCSLKSHKRALYYHDVTTGILSTTPFYLDRDSKKDMGDIYVCTNPAPFNEETCKTLEKLYGKSTVPSFCQIIAGELCFDPRGICFMLGHYDSLPSGLVELPIEELVPMFRESGAWYKFGLELKKISSAWQSKFEPCERFFKEQIEPHWKLDSSAECLFANDLESTNKLYSVLREMHDFKLIHQEVALGEKTLDSAISDIQNDYEKVKPLIPKCFSGMHKILDTQLELRKKELTLAADNFATPPSTKKIKM